MSQIVPLIFLGLGNVGGALLRQILDTREQLDRRAGLRLDPVVLADISGALFSREGLSEQALRSALRAAADSGRLDALPGVQSLDVVEQALRPGVILVDVTASSQTEPVVRAALERDCGVVLANKLSLAAPWDQAQDLFAHKRIRYETTVGAGLPVVDTLRYLLDTGDRITAIEGCFSGTLGYLCTELERGATYAGAIETARELGYTEPDPREDLSGRDVARKALILGRTAGWPLNVDDLRVEKLYSDSLAELTVQAFMDIASSMNLTYADRFERAMANGKTLRYAVRVGPDGGQVGLLPVPKDSALGALHGPENYVAFHTERYMPVPLSIAGPGAGPEVTAAGVLGDIIDLAQNSVQSVFHSCY